MKIVSVEQIRSKLDDRFRLLTGGSRTALPRHQTLQATIQWSYEQLTGAEQRLFRTLSVFAGGSSLEAAARVAGGGADELATMDLLTRLVDKSLVLVERGRGHDPRYRMLETVRQYAKERLSEAGEAEAARRRHLEEFAALAERSYADRLEREEPWSSALECLRIQLEQGDPLLVNRARVALAQTLVALGRIDEARSMSREILAFAATHDDRRSEHFGWHFLADCALIEGRCEESIALYRKSLVLARAIGDRLEASFEIQGVAMSLAGLGDAEQAHRLGAAVRAEMERLGLDPHMRFWDALLDRYLGRARCSLGEEAAERIERAGRLLTFDEAVESALASGGARTT